MSEQTIAINVLRSSEPSSIEKFLDYGNFLREVRERGFNLVVSTKSTYTEIDSSWRVPEIVDGKITFSEQQAALDSLKAVQTRIKVAGDYTIPAPVINADELRKFAGSKRALSTHLGEYSIPTQFVTNENRGKEYVENSLDLVDTELVVVKPDKGSAGSGLQIVSKKRALDILLTEGASQDYLVQPLLRTACVPEGVSGDSASDQELVERVKSTGTAAEVRIFVIKNDTDLTLAPMLRTADIGSQICTDGGHYIDINLSDNLAEFFYLTTRNIVRSISSDSNLNAKHLVAAIDYAFDGERMYIMEGNFRSPSLPLSNELPKALKILYPAMADTLVHMAKVGK